MSAFLLPFLLGSPALAGDIVVAMQTPVVVVVDGQVLKPAAGSMQARARDLGEGAHLVEIRTAFNKPITELTVELGEDEEVRLRYARKALEEIGRGTLKKSAARDEADPEGSISPAAGPEETMAALEAQQAELSAMASGFGNAQVGATPGGGAVGAPASGASSSTTTQVSASTPAGGVSVSVSVTETSSGGTALAGPGGLAGGGSGGMAVNSTAFVGLDPMLFAITIDGRPLPWVDAVGGFLATELAIGSKHAFRMTLQGNEAYRADMTVDTRGHEICVIRVMPFDYDIACSSTGKGAYTAADLAGLHAAVPGAALSHTRPTGMVPVPAGPQAMAPGDFERLLASVEAESFSSGQVDIIATAARNNHFTCRQLARLIEPISFGSDQMKAVEAAHEAVIDPGNAHELEAVFSFSSDKEAVRALFR